MSDRRRNSDRRNVSARRDRRRKNDQRVFVIELTADELRVAELQRATAEDEKDTVAAAVVRWRNEAATLQSPEGLTELTATLRELARTRAMHGADVRMVLSGEFCIMRTIRGTIEEVRGELQQLEQRSRLYLSLGPGEKVLVSHTRMLDARHAHVLAAVCLRATLETIQSAAEGAGIEIAVIEPALSSLNRAVSRLPDVPAEPYLLLHVNRAAIELGVCHDGQLLMDYRPGGRTEIVDLPKLLETHRNRLSRHVGRCLRTAPPSLNCVFLCGDGDAVQAARKQFKRDSTLEVRAVNAEQVQATWQFREGDGTVVTPAALGALLASYLPEIEWNSPNLMQHILDRKREPLRPRLIRSAIPLAATLLAAMGLTLVNVQQQRTLNIMQTELDSLAVIEGRANELRLQLQASQSKLTELEKLADQLPLNMGKDLISSLTHCMPNDVWLSRLEIHDRRSIRLEGASYLEAGVYDFVRWLEQAPGLEEVALKRTNPSSSISGPTTSFELELTLGKLEPTATKVALHE